MFFESIISISLVLIYLLWKFLIPEKRPQVQFSESGVDESIENQKKTTPLADAKGSSIINIANKENVEPARRVSLEKNEFEKVNNSINDCNENYVNSKIVDTERNEKIHNVLENITFEHRKQITEPHVPQSYDITNSKEIITPSVLLKQQNEKNIEKLNRRESPPKEKLAEFLEKTILSGDKIQSIIQNLSLDKDVILKTEEDYVSAIKPIDSKLLVKENNFSEKATKLQESIDEIADTIKHLSSSETKQGNLDYRKYSDNEQEKESCIETNKQKPLLARLQKQSGVPSGVNFGSLIGELKSKTRNTSNTSLKPVFKKFDLENDTVDSAQVIIFLCNF